MNVATQLVVFIAVLQMVRLHSGMPFRPGPSRQILPQHKPSVVTRSTSKTVHCAGGSGRTRPRPRSCDVAASSRLSKTSSVRSLGLTSSRRSSSAQTPRARASHAEAKSVTTPACVGSVTETDAQHRKRHPKVQPNCPRCMYLQWSPHWEKHYGSHRSEVRSQKVATVWLAPRPARLGGFWAIGCRFCAQWAQTQADRKSAAKTAGVVMPKRRRGPSYGQTKWARFEVRSSTQVAMRGVSQHAKTLMHRQATRAYFAPELPWETGDTSCVHVTLATHIHVVGSGEVFLNT